MSDELIRQDSSARQCLRAVAWACLVIALVGDLTGLIDRVLPPRYGLVLSKMAVGLMILAYRRPGATGWFVVLLAWAGIAAVTCYQLMR
jgi:hypothetical protein